ncbi:hypothetical protein [Saccharothrix sp.]|uniref:hypothetical protein n=1 Tax=Saccharothrix sp. TaxID=1873460 RepID=UPI0028111AAA|nr:hypothetical protein [Saccharothrix sp.]
MEHDLATVPMIEVVPAALLADANPYQDEIRRRWELATRTPDGSLRPQLGPNNAWWPESGAPDPDPVAVEHARSYLGVLTLIHNLWTLQEADIAPNRIFASPDGPQRVVEVLRREYARGERQQALEANTEPEPHAEIPGQLAMNVADDDPLGAAAAFLAMRTEEALLHQPRVLDISLNRLAGRAHPQFLADIAEVCKGILRRLHGPWTLERFLVDPVGEDFYLFHDPEEFVPATGLDVALGRLGEPVSHKEIRSIRDELRTAVNERAATLTDLPALDPATVDGPRLQRMHATMREHLDFFLDALAVVDLAADHHARVDGRPIAPELRGHFLAMHQSAAHHGRGAVPTTHITVAGLIISHRHDHAIGETVVDIAAANSERTLPVDELPQVLAMLLQPRTDAITSLDSIEAALRRVELDFGRRLHRFGVRLDRLQLLYGVESDHNTPQRPHLASPLAPPNLRGQTQWPKPHGTTTR